jgi:hypothetical protein
MRTLRQIAAVSGVAFTLAAASAAAHAEKLTIMVGGATKIIYLPAKLTEQLGYCSRARCKAWWASTITRSTCKARARKFRRW